MEQINNIELVDPSIYPTDEILKRILGKSFSVYLKLLRLYENYSLIPEWKYYKDGKAWLCKVIKGKKTIVWMSAWKNYIKVTIYLPEKHINGVLVLDIHEITKKAFIETNNIGRSRPCMFELKKENILEDFIKVMQFKMTLK